MSDKIIALLSLCVSVPMAVGYYKKVMGGNARQDRFIDKAKQNGCVTTGVCVDTEYLPGDINGDNLTERSAMMKVKYEYRVDGMKYYKYLRFQDIGCDLLDYPEQITIFYDKRNPRKTLSRMEFSASSRKQSGCLGAIGIWFVITAILTNILKFIFLE